MTINDPASVETEELPPVIRDPADPGPGGYQPDGGYHPDGEPTTAHPSGGYYQGGPPGIDIQSESGSTKKAGPAE
jgi:hypothetical protein